MTVRSPKPASRTSSPTSSAICYLDGDRGVLAYLRLRHPRSGDAERGVSFEEVCYLLWHRRLPTRAELGDLQSQLAAARPLPEPIIRRCDRCRRSTAWTRCAR